MAKKKKELDFSRIVPNYDAAKWCINNGYRVYPVWDKPLNNVRPDYYVEVEKPNKHRIKTKRTFNKKELSGAMWHMYEFYYNKHSKA